MWGEREHQRLFTLKTRAADTTWRTFFRTTAASYQRLSGPKIADGDILKV